MLPDVTWLRGVLHDRTPFVVCLGGPEDAAAVRHAVDALDRDSVAAIRIGNPLTVPLSLERIMLQLALDDGDALPGDDAGRVLRAVVAHSAGRPLLLVVEQAQTLTTRALDFLQLLPGLRHAGVPSIQVLFVGTAEFAALLQDPRFSAIRRHVPELPAEFVEAESEALPPAIQPMIQPRPRRRYLAVGVGGAALVVLVAAMLSRPPPSVPALPAPTPAVEALAPVRTEAAKPVEPAAAALPGPAPVNAPVVAPVNAPVNAPVDKPVEAAVDAPAEPSVEASVEAYTPSPAADAALAAPPLLPAEPGPEDAAAARARLFGEFNAFVEARGLSDRLSRSDRKELFQEYLARRYADAAARPATEPARAAAGRPQLASLPGGPSVVVFFQSGSATSEASATRDVGLLQDRASAVLMRPTFDSPPMPTIRFYRAADRDAAASLAAALAAPGTEWRIEDRSGGAEQGVQLPVEVWLPREPG